MVKVVVIGGGMGGVRAAKKLDATLITNSKNFVFLPRIPEIIGGRKKGISIPIKDTVNDVVIGTASKIDTKKQVVYVGKKKIAYDYLIIATGASPAAPVPGVRTYAKFFYTIEDAKVIKKLLPRKQVVIVGAGPTGVEVAVEIAATTPVILLQGGKDILPTFQEKTRRFANNLLEEVGIDVRTNQRVERITASGVHTKDSKINADLIIWTAGIKANLVPGIPADRGHIVNDYLQVQGTKNVFSIGDCANTGAPLTAQAAMQEADVAAVNIKRLQQGEPLKAYTYVHRGSFLHLSKTARIEAFIHVHGSIAKHFRELYYNFRLFQYR